MHLRPGPLRTPLIELTAILRALAGFKGKRRKRQRKRERKKGRQGKWKERKGGEKHLPK